MIGDILTVVRKEWLEFMQPEPTRRLGPYRIVGFIVLGGAFVGWQLEPDFGRSWFTVFLVSFLSMMFVSGVVPDSVAGERERHTLETLLATRLPDEAIVLGKVIAAVTYGCAMGWAILPTGILAANLFHGAPGEPWVRLEVILLALATSAIAGLAIAGLGVLLSLYAPTARQANQRLGFAMMGLLFVPAIAITALPETLRAEILVSLDQERIAHLVAGVFGAAILFSLVVLSIAVYRFRRTRLVL